MSVPLIQRILNFAHKSFSRLEGSGDVGENVAKLTELVNGFTVDDISFDKEVIDDDTKYDAKVHEAPVGYVYLWDSPYLSMGVFIVRNGQQIPLHNHPNMHGILKVIHGTAEIKSFSDVTEEHKEPPKSFLESLQSWQRQYVKAFEKHEPVLVTKDSDVCVLSPGKNNVHEISATNGTTAFLDILTPPYDKEHTCCYYNWLEQDGAVREVQGSDGQKKTIQYLQRCAHPKSFFCQPLDYYGPIIQKPEADDHSDD